MEYRTVASSCAPASTAMQCTQPSRKVVGPPSVQSTEKWPRSISRYVLLTDATVPVHGPHETSSRASFRAVRLKQLRISLSVHHDRLRRQTAYMHILDGFQSISGESDCSPCPAGRKDSVMHPAPCSTSVIYPPPAVWHLVLGILGARAAPQESLGDAPFARAREQLTGCRHGNRAQLSKKCA